MLVVWVDDIILVGPEVDRIKAGLASKLDIDDRGELTWFLGFEVQQSDAEVRISQQRAIEQLIDRFCMSGCKGSRVVFPSGVTKASDEADSPILQEEVQRQFRGLVGSLGYLANVCRPDLSFAVSYLSGFLGKARVVHWEAAKHVLKYLMGSKSLFLRYRRVPTSLLNDGSSVL